MLYDLVLSGKWTLDKMIQLSEGTYSDLNGNNLQDDEDQYGYMGQTTQVQPLFWGCGITAIDVDDGKMSVSQSFTGEKMHGLLEKILNWMYNSGDARYSSKGNTAFSEGRLLFFQNVAIFPVGTVMKTKLGYTIVKEVTPGQTQAPVVCLFANEKQQPLETPRIVLLSNFPSSVIESVLDDQELLTLSYRMHMDPATLLTDDGITE